MADDLKKGLEGVLVAESSLSHIDGEEGKLIYRGYAIEDLAREARYEEVLYLLWYGELPTQTELDSFTDEMVAERAIDDDILATTEALALADAEPMAALRTVVSQLSATDPAGETDPEDSDATLEKSRRLTAKIPTIIAAFDRYRDGNDPVSPREDLGHAANFLYMLNDEEPDEIATETFDAALVLHVDHGLNASTFSGMVTASTLSDVHSAVTSAIGTLKGSLHGGANQDVMEMLLEVNESDKDPVRWVEDALDSDRRVAGFGHRVYDVKDPRAYILGEFSESLADEAGEMKWYDYSVAIEEFMQDKKGIAPNVDFYSATTYYQMDIPIDLFTPIFALSRVGGWTAHVAEQLEDNRIMRPRGRYVGPEDQEFVPVEER